MPVLIGECDGTLGASGHLHGKSIRKGIGKREIHGAGGLMFEARIRDEFFQPLPLIGCQSVNVDAHLGPVGRNLSA
ncbi:hypothetical protein BGV72_12075 [Burkholderia ubonensis]|nr:hypothetical protein BGV72_12075 [Burkholderia ubonensis]